MSAALPIELDVPRDSAASRNYTEIGSADSDAALAWEYPSMARNRNTRRGLRLMWELPTAVRMCGLPRTDVTLERGLETQRACWAGRFHCGRLAACPVCRDEAMGEWRAELLQLLEASRDRGATPMLVTFTMPHRQGMKLRHLDEVLLGAFRAMTGHSRWRTGLKPFGYLGMVRVLETTWSALNGWHPHLHVMMLFGGDVDPEMLERAGEWIRSQWGVPLYDHAQKAGLELPASDLLRAVDCRLGMAAGEYLTKIGLAPELTAPGAKRGRQVGAVRHYGIPEIQERLALSMLRYGRNGPTLRERDMRRFTTDRRLVAEYVAAMKGRHILHISRGLKEKIDALPLRPDVVPELATNASTPAVRDSGKEHIYTFTQREFERFHALGPLAETELDRLLESGAPVERVRAFIADCLEGRWRPATDRVWGEDGDSPLFADRWCLP